MSKPRSREGIVSTSERPRHRGSVRTTAGLRNRKIKTELLDLTTKSAHLDGEGGRPQSRSVPVHCTGSVKADERHDESLQRRTGFDNPARKPRSKGGTWDSMESDW